MTPLVPILRRILFAALLAASFAASALACRFCDAPSPVPPGTQEADAPLDLRVPPGLLPGELESIQASDPGRYVLRGSYIDDTRPSSPKAHLVTLAAAQPFFTAPARERVEVLRAKKAAGTLTAEDLKAAQLLFWHRGPLLSEPEREFLRSLNPLQLGPAPAKGKDAKAGTLSVSGGGMAASGDGLIAQFLQRVELAGDAEQKAALVESVGLLLGTPTGRQLASEFVATGAKARVGFVEIANSQVLTQNGKKVMNASGGYANSAGDVIQISLNRDYLQTDPQFRRHYMTATLGHELLGHGLESARAKKAGVFPAYGIYRENEANAGLVGWIVTAELGAKLDNGHMWRYLKDPEEYHQGLRVNLPYYTTTFNADEIRDGVATLKSRLERVRKELAGMPGFVSSWESWRPIIVHFVSIHKMVQADFASLLELIDNNVKKYAPSRTATLKGIIAHLETTIAYYETTEGAARLARHKAAFSKPFFAEEEARLQVRRARLEEVTRGKASESFSPPSPGQVTFGELQAMHAKDKKEHPEHWK
ncbi:MAG: hypothetical protein A2X36_00065 [Elusimicrobia bacterium GWA2_69_24]|nr:MAG: hypothetical protein A2X36_00065 [Elusimicrobia bacterium GWA2_69_24]HBL19073.1 hypothetical protein [Elusimicrobiota bacterium]